MSTSSDDQPTKVLPQAAPDQPSAVAAPATRRSPTWQERVPAHIGRARTSTLVLGAVFVVLFVLNLFLPSQDSGTRTITTSDGETLEVPCTVVECDEPTTPPTPTSTPTAPSSSVPADDGEDAEDAEDDEPVNTPTRTTSRPPAPTSTPAPTPTRAPSPTSETTDEEETTEPTPTATTTTTEETTADPAD